MTLEFTPDDRAFLNWLEKAEDVERIQILRYSTQEICVNCTDRWQANRLIHYRDLLKGTQFAYAKIYIGGNLYETAPLLTATTDNKSMIALETMPSVWARQNLNVLQAIPATVALHSTEPGFRYLALKPEISEGRLNKPVDTLINQPLRAIDEELWVPRERAIQDCISTGENQTYFYEHKWREMIWYFKCTIAKVSDSEVMSLVEDNLLDARALWQKGWWVSHANQI